MSGGGLWGFRTSGCRVFALRFRGILGLSASVLMCSLRSYVGLGVKGSLKHGKPALLTRTLAHVFLIRKLRLLGLFNCTSCLAQATSRRQRSFRRCLCWTVNTGKTSSLARVSGRMCLSKGAFFNSKMLFKLFGASNIGQATTVSEMPLIRFSTAPRLLH